MGSWLWFVPKSSTGVSIWYLHPSPSIICKQSQTGKIQILVLTSPRYCTMSDQLNTWQRLYTEHDKKAQWLGGISRWPVVSGWIDNALDQGTRQGIQDRETTTQACDASRGHQTWSNVYFDTFRYNQSISEEQAIPNECCMGLLCDLASPNAHAGYIDDNQAIICDIILLFKR